MNYKESKKILKEIKKAKRILINCHRRPDPDSVSSAVASVLVFKNMGKKVKIISPDPIPKNLSYLPLFDEIEIVRYDKFDFSNYNVFFVLDSVDWDVVSDDRLEKPPENIFLIQVDHHEVQKKFTDLRLIDSSVGSTSEILYCLFEDWNVSLNKKISTSLLSGIIADTVSFKIPSVTSRTLKIASELMKNGADRATIMDSLFNNVKLDLLKFFGEVMNRLEYEEEDQFVWSAIPHEVFKKHGKPGGAKNVTANMFFGGIEKSKFGAMMVEEAENRLGVSFRSVGRFDTSKIARELGGGGHKDSSATKIEGLPFDKAVEKVLKVARKYAKTYKK